MTMVVRPLINPRTDLNPENKIYVYGSGNAGRHVAVYIRDLFGIQVAGFLDSYADGHVDGFPVHSFDSYMEKHAQSGSTQIIIASDYEVEILKFLESRNFNGSIFTNGVSFYFKINSDKNEYLRFLDQESQNKLSILVVGTGRDGTRSLTHMIKDVFEREGQGRTADHEWRSDMFYMLECEYRETGDTSFLDKARDLIRSCPHDCVVGNGYAPLLPLFREVIGPDLVLVHLRRNDRDRCVASLVENAMLFPDGHRYYAPETAITRDKRITAFHYGEATIAEWQSWSIEHRFGWYYDKTHAMIDAAAPAFDTVLNIETESLDSQKTRDAIKAAIGTSLTLRAIHANKHHPGIDALPRDMRYLAQHLLNMFDVSKMATDELHALRHFLDVYAKHIRSKNSPALSSEFANLLRKYIPKSK